VKILRGLIQYRPSDLNGRWWTPIPKCQAPTQSWSFVGQSTIRTLSPTFSRLGTTAPTPTAAERHRIRTKQVWPPRAQHHTNLPHPASMLCAVKVRSQGRLTRMRRPSPTEQANNFYLGPCTHRWWRDERRVRSGFLPTSLTSCKPASDERTHTAFPVSPNSRWQTSRSQDGGDRSEFRFSWHVRVIS
jgi:hypothetical protein